MRDTAAAQGEDRATQRLTAARDDVWRHATGPSSLGALAAARRRRDELIVAAVDEAGLDVDAVAASAGTSVGYVQELVASDLARRSSSGG